MISIAITNEGKRKKKKKEINHKRWHLGSCIKTGGSIFILQEWSSGFGSEFPIATNRPPGLFCPSTSVQMKAAARLSCFLLVTIILAAANSSVGIRFSGRLSETPADEEQLRTAVFALGSFWRSEAVFGCLDGVVRTTVGYAGGSKTNPGYRSLGDHAESVQIEYDPRIITFKQLLEVFWTSHDSRQVFGQGPDVGNQYRSIVFTNGTEESRLASVSKEREQTRSKSGIVTTQIQRLETFYRAEPDHQKFELKRHPFLLQLMGNLPEEELEKSSLAAKLNGYAAELCPPRMQKHIDAKINDIIKKGWPILREG